METIRYSLISKEDLRLGTGTFKATLADGREVTLTQVDMVDQGSTQTITGIKTMASPVLTTPTINTPTITSPAITGTTTIGAGATITNPAIIGTTTNDDAAAGKIGEYQSAGIGFGSAISLTTATPANVTSISLTAGDWDVSGVIYFV